MIPIWLLVFPSITQDVQARAFPAECKSACQDYADGDLASHLQHLVHTSPLEEVTAVDGERDSHVLSRLKLPFYGTWLQVDRNRSAQPAFETKLNNKSPAASGIQEVKDKLPNSSQEESAHHSKEQYAKSEEALEAESFSLSVFLIGTVGSFMCVLHLLHWPTQTGSVKATTMRVLNMTFSIFISVLVYGSVKATLLAIFKPGLIESKVMTLLLFLKLYVSCHSILFQLKGGDRLNLSAASTLLAHITGFAASHGFSDLMEIEFFKESGATGPVLLIFIAAIVISALSFIMEMVMRAFADAQEDEEEELWIDVCKQGDDDVFSLAISFLVVGLIRYVIRGKYYPYEPGKVGSVTQTQCDQLALCGVCFFLIVIMGAVGIHYKGIHYKHVAAPFLERVVSCFQHITSTTTAWVCLFYAEWQLHVVGWGSTIIGGSLVAACSMTFLSLLCVLMLTFFSSRIEGGKMFRRALRSVELALGVLIGLSWERAFDVGFGEVSLRLEKSRHFHHSVVVVVIMSALLFVVVAPAWRFYILPPTIAADKLER